MVIERSNQFVIGSNTPMVSGILCQRFTSVAEGELISVGGRWILPPVVRFTSRQETESTPTRKVEAVFCDRFHRERGLGH